MPKTVQECVYLLVLLVSPPLQIGSLVAVLKPVQFHNLPTLITILVYVKLTVLTMSQSMYLPMRITLHLLA